MKVWVLFQRDPGTGGPELVGVFGERRKAERAVSVHGALHGHRIFPVVLDRGERVALDIQDPIPPREEP